MSITTPFSPKIYLTSNNQQATRNKKQASKKQAGKQHFFSPFGPLLCSTASGSTIL